MSTLNLEHIKHENSSSNNITVDSDGSVAVNRHTSDGTIIDLQKDGTSVGSIGTLNADLIVGESAACLRFDGENETIAPSTTTGVFDARIRLGSSTQRFKDLYLSGGVYLGGTGAANYLDDYEEGTWTGAATASGGATVIEVINENYTKIGNTVYITFTVNFTSAFGTLQVTGLPFSSTPEAVGIGREDASSGYATYGRVSSAGTGIDIFYAGATGNASAFQVASGNMRFSMTYRTTA